MDKEQIQKTVDGIQHRGRCYLLQGEERREKERVVDRPHELSLSLRSPMMGRGITDSWRVGGKEFIIALLQQVKETLFAPASPPERVRTRVSVKKKKARTQNIFEEIVECITAQNPKKRQFGLCLSERCFTAELFVPFCRVVESNKLLSNLSLVHCDFSSVESNSWNLGTGTPPYRKPPV